MTHGPEHQIEQAEHAAHASHDGFNKNVTMSIAIVAAVLACVSMLGHRAHNETLRLQGEALSLQSEAGIESTNAANQWSRYQSKNIFSVQSEVALDILSVAPIRQGKQEDYDRLVERLEGNVEYYNGDKNYRTAKSNKKAASADEDAKKDKKDEKKDDKKEEKKPQARLAELEAEGHNLVAKTKSRQKEAEKKIKDSHQEHLKAERLDLGELGLQFAVVLCSLAILTRNRGFWFGGIASGVIGAAVSVTGQFGMFMGEHH